MFLLGLCLYTSFSNRCFWTKAISIWTSTGDADHVMIVGSYFHYAGGFEPPQVTCRFSSILSSSTNSISLQSICQTYLVVSIYCTPLKQQSFVFQKTQVLLTLLVYRLWIYLLILDAQTPCIQSIPGRQRQPEIQRSFSQITFSFLKCDHHPILTYHNLMELCIF